jgi:hypothetical protein
VGGLAMVTGKRKESSSTGLGYLRSFVIIIAIMVLYIIIVAILRQPSKEKDQAQSEQIALNRFNTTIERHYQELRNFYDNKDFHEATRKFELFKKYQKTDYKDVVDIGEGIRIGTIKELEKEARAIPVAKTADNLRIYKQLLELDPENSKYKSKVAFYQANIDAFVKSQSNLTY